ncbi:hypothetical protein ACTID9_04065 [Brevibacillus fluminis]
MSFLYVIRHAQVEIDPAIPPAEWSLSPEGWTQTDQMAQRVSWEDIVSHEAGQMSLHNQKGPHKALFGSIR